MRTFIKILSVVIIFIAFFFYIAARQLGLFGYEIIKEKTTVPNHIIYSIEIWNNGHKIYWDNLFYKENDNQDSLSHVVDSIISARILEYKYWQKKKWGLK